MISIRKTYFLTVLFVLAFAPLGQAQVLYNNLAAAPSDSCCSGSSTGTGDPVGSNWGPLADSFSTGASSFDFTGVTVLLNGTSSNGTITAYLLSNSIVSIDGALEQSPGAVLETIGTLSESSLSDSNALYTFLASSSYTLAANTTYWIELSATDNAANWSWSLDTSGVGVADQYFANQQGTGSFLTFPNTDGPYQMEVASSVLTLTETGLGTGTVTDNLGLINCSESGGQTTGSCSATYASGAQVTLTATASSSAPNGGPSTFGGWGGACASTGIYMTCALSMTSSQNVSASFVAPPTITPIIPETCSGTNVTGTVSYCPNNNGTISSTNPCTDPNGFQFSVTIPVVNQPTQGESCLALSVTATEVSGNGVDCPSGGTGQTGPFDCRFADFYSYGTDPTTGNMVTPLPYPFANGNSMSFTLALTCDTPPCGVPPSNLIGAGVYWEVAFNNAFAPPAGSYWYGSTPSLLDDPGEDEIPPLPWGTNCSTAMTDDPGGPSGTYYCQFDNNITTFYQPGGGSFDPAGGKTQQPNDVALVFLPTSVPTGSTQSPPANVAPAISGNCVNGCTPLGPASNGATIMFTEGTGGTLQVQVTAGYPAPTLTAATTGTTTIASESGNTVTLTSAGSYGPQAVYGNTVIVGGCSPAGYNGTFAIASASGGGTTLTYVDTTTGLAPGVGCQALVLPNGLTFNSATGLIAGTPADGTEGSYAVSFTATNSVGFATLNYTLTVNPAGTLTVTASSPSMTYGGTVPAITPSYAGFVNGDTPASLTTQPTCSTTATSSSAVGSSPTTSCSGAVDPNYSTIKYVNGAVMVTPAPLTIIAGNGTMTYGGTPPIITPSFVGLVNGDNAATLGVTCTSAATSSSPVGNGYTSSCSAATGTNYTITYVTGTVTVTQARLVITASSATINYGALVPAITASYSGFVNGDTAANLTTQPTCSTTAVSTKPGTYPSSCTGATDPNYTISYINGTVTVGALEISPSTLNFGNVYFDWVGIQFLTLTNTGTTPITISNITISGGNAASDYGDLSFCTQFFSKMPGTIPAGKSCVIGVGILAIQKIFSPTASTATLILTDSSAGSPQSVPLTALVINPQATLSTNSLTFATQKVGTTSAAKSVTLTNTGNTTLSLGTLTISGNFALAGGTTCSNGGTVAAGSSCLLNVTFTPTAKGTRTGTLTITDNVLTSPQFVSLSGTGD